MLVWFSEEQHRQLAEQRDELEKQQEELRSQYDKRIQDMETSFESEISGMKEKYEAQISGLHSKLSAAGDLSEESSQERDVTLPTALSTPQQREYVHKTMALTAISDTDSDLSADASRSLPPDDYPTRLKVLEAELIDRDSQLNELRARLKRQESPASSDTEQELTDLRLKVTQLQQDASTALSRCSELQALLEQKDFEIQQLQGEKKDLNIILEEKSVKIDQLEAEKAESEKLYKDLLERESPRSKGSHSRDMPSGSSVDDSFASARDSIHNTPRSYVSDHLDFTSPRSDLGEDENKHHSNNSNINTRDLNDSIPFANDSSDYPDGNGNNNNNNNSNTAALEVAVEDLKRKVEELDNQLASAKEREAKLRSQIEESEHNHEEAIEVSLLWFGWKSIWEVYVWLVVSFCMNIQENIRIYIKLNDTCIHRAKAFFISFCPLYACIIKLNVDANIFLFHGFLYVEFQSFTSIYWSLKLLLR